MLKNFCFCPSQYCSSNSQSSFNYQSLSRPLDRAEDNSTIGNRVKNRRLVTAAESSCSSSCRSNSIEAVEDSGGGAFTFLSSSTIGTSATSHSITAPNNSIHFYHPKSIQTNSSSSTASIRTNTDEDSAKKQDHGSTNICKGLISNLAPLSESIRVQLQRCNNKENLKSGGRITSRLIRSTAVINLKPSPPVTQPPSLNGID